MRQLIAAVAALLVVTAALADNDDTCDIGHAPAATLLLPYFEVDFHAPQATARTMLCTIQNTSAIPQIARVTLWTDWGYPMFTFNVVLTGYGVQGINLHDVFTQGTAALTTCSSNPGAPGAALLDELRDAFTLGKISAPGCAVVKDVGGKHFNAIGYATIDVVANCNTTSPLGAGYFTRDILFDNVLTGDYEDVNPNPITGNFASGSPLVHIRAVPEGGPAGAFVATNLPYTFYDLYTAEAPSRTQNRRQPLPSAFLPRVIQGGTGAFNTNLLVWREAFAAPALCPISYGNNSAVPFAESVRFDEHENATVYAPCSNFGCSRPAMPLTSAQFSLNSNFLPLSTSGDLGGWIFLNLDNGKGARQSQAWVITSMYADGRFAVAMDAAAVGNGCSPAPDLTTRARIGPAPNTTP